MTQEAEKGVEAAVATGGVGGRRRECKGTEENLYVVVRLSEQRDDTCTIAQSDPSETVIHRAMYLLQNGFGNYDVFENNCEDFAIYCKTEESSAPMREEEEGEDDVVVVRKEERVRETVEEEEDTGE
ncbi:hypothetical protein Droror1_Dr00011754 [Drosera rotundifolia]